VARRSVRDDTVPDYDVPVVIVSMFRIIAAIIAVVCPRTRDSSINKHDECPPQVDPSVSRRRAFAGDPNATGSRVPKLAIPNIVIHIVIWKIVIADRTFVVVGRRPRRWYIILNVNIKAKAYLSHACVREKRKRDQ